MNDEFATPCYPVYHDVSSFILHHSEFIISSSVLRVLRHLLAGLELDVSFLPVGPGTGCSPSPPRLALKDGGVDRVDPDLEDRFDRRLDFGFVGVGRDPKHQRPVALLRIQPLLGVQRLVQNLIGVLRHPSALVSRVNAPSEINNRSWLRTSKG